MRQLGLPSNGNPLGKVQTADKNKTVTMIEKYILQPNPYIYFVLIVSVCSDQDIVWFITIPKYLNKSDLSIAVEFIFRETSI